MSPFAEDTTVSPEKSQMEIAGLVRRYGADGFAIGWEGETAAVSFRSHGRTVRLSLAMPKAGERRFTHTPTGQQRTADGAARALRAEERRRWRALALTVKAKLEAVETGIATFEDEWLAYTVLPGGRTVGETVQPEVSAAIAEGRPARLQIGGA